MFFACKSFKLVSYLILHVLLNWTNPASSTVDVINNFQKNIIVVFSRQNSGSSFFSELIQSWENNTFYDFEPLFKTDIQSHVRANRRGKEAINLLTRVMKCDYSASKAWIDATLKQEPKNFLSRNPKLLRKIQEEFPHTKSSNKRLIKLFDDLCKRSRIHLIKVLRLRMDQVGKMFREMEPDLIKTLKVIFLFRDPRAVYNSRKMRGKCSEKCTDIESICSDMETNIIEFLNFRKKYPHQAFIVRFEDVSQDPKSLVKNFFPKALNFTLNNNVEQYLSTHTLEEGIQWERPHSTIRNSKITTFKWSTQITLKDLKRFDETCRSTLKLGGYKLYDEVREGGELSNILWLTDVPEQLKNF